MPEPRTATPRRWSSVPMSLRRASRSRRRPRQSGNFDAEVKRSGMVIPSLKLMFAHNADVGRAAIARHYDSSCPSRHAKPSDGALELLRRVGDAVVLRAGTNMVRTYRLVADLHLFRYSAAGRAA